LLHVSDRFGCLTGYIYYRDKKVGVFVRFSCAASLKNVAKVLIAVQAFILPDMRSKPPTKTVSVAS
jgi:hypothetical protein